jgi:hypothetical protein
MEQKYKSLLAGRLEFKNFNSFPSRSYVSLDNRAFTRWN